MFNTKKLDSFAAPGNADSIEPSAPAVHPATGEYAAPDRTKPPVHALVDECLTVRGDLESNGDILIKGNVFGNVHCKLLIIDTDASVEGGIDAEEVIIRGRSTGKINAKRVRMENTAIVESEIIHQIFSADEGARIMGTLRHMDETASASIRTETTKPASSRNTSKSAPSSAAASEAP
ncbi:polymer-forming cytoskeletal protein [Hyphomicrobium sp. D-2]|uniref:bactofilin family protein n=1 Tax=Hyphomicrobium sp. D-2 TaxID=3041621 RepID=UPI0024570069|nr:polymer-forming cytoskeletal protein [Hyphomicrobium sp. D-2]MDH4982370.1 polymer-forming cytoskeletal protein [Hyphomicrobium sp. D-2]